MEPQSFTRRQLYDLVWKEPIQTLAPKFGLSDRGLAKLCERHAIPTPPRGYWAKKQAGQKVAKIPLVELDGALIKDSHAIARFAPPPRSSDDEPDPLLVFWRHQRDEIGDIKVPRTLASPHPIIAGWIQEDDRQRERRAGSPWLGSLPAAPPRPTSVERRKLRVLSALYKALEQRGVTVSCARNSRDVELRHEHDRLSFTLYEYTKQKRTPLTDDERKTHWNSNATFKQEDLQTGFLRGKVDVYLPRGIPVTWTETEDKPIETFVADVVATLLTAFAYRKAQRERAQAEERIRWQREEKRRAEEKRRQHLCAQALAWKTARELRDYIEAVEGAVRAGRLAIEATAFSEWSTWASDYAKALDPIESANPFEQN